MNFKEWLVEAKSNEAKVVKAMKSIVKSLKSTVGGNPKMKKGKDGLIVFEFGPIGVEDEMDNQIKVFNVSTMVDEFEENGFQVDYGFGKKTEDWFGELYKADDVFDKFEQMEFQLS